MANKFTISTTFEALNHMTGPISKMVRDVEQFGKRISKSLDPVKRGFSAIGKFAQSAGTIIGAAGVGMVALAKNAAQYGDDLNDMASILGTTTQTLEEYRFAASLVGIESEQMDAALSKLTVNLGKGGEATNEALQKIGVSAEMLRNAGPDRVLETIADGFKNLKSPQDKAAVATALFGKSSVKLVNVLSKGSGAIADLRKEAVDLGAVMSDEMVAQAGEMDDSWTRMMAGMKGLKNRLGRVVFPQILTLVKGVTNFLTVNGDKIGKVFKTIGDVVSGVFGYVGSILEKIKPNLSFVPKVIENVAKFFELMRPAIERVASTIMKVFGPAIEFISKILIALTPLFDGLSAAFEGVGSVVEILLPILEELAPVVNVLAIAFGGLGQALGIVGDIVKTIFGSMGAGMDFMKNLFNGEGISIERIQALNQKAIQQAADASPFANGKTGERLSNFGNTVSTSFSKSREKRGEVPLSPNTQVINSNSTVTNRSTVDLNFNNPPPGSTMRQTGTAPGVNLNMGRTGK